MAEKKFKGAPFGTQVARFDVSAVHPANKRIGNYTEIPYCKKITNERMLGPGSYDVAGHGDFSERSVAQRAKGPGWRKAQETARLAAIPHILYREAWENKHFLKSQVGPASYKIADFIEEIQKKTSSVRGVCNSREERFRNVESSTPGPGSYDEWGVPWAELEKKVGSNTAPSTHLRASLQRFPKGNPTDSGLSPCTYSLKSSTDILLARRTSKRGPYDLFTGSRDKPIPGFFAVPRVNWTSEESSLVGVRFGDELGRREKRNHGVFATLDQYPAVPTERIYRSTLSQCAQPATSPGPGWYDAVPPRSWPTCHTSAPFLCSAPRTSRQAERQRNGNYNTVGPGRYNIAGTGRSKSANCAMSAFSSQTQRYLHKPEKDKYAQERLRAVNVPLEKRNFLVPPRRNTVMTVA
ncbi:hypothetical protein UPYG_G00028560 [Umbra pygmaea]|uniref:Uncharacterized protein n=1 Tax=Umbra pygmaea TaxID=75934 RepID=A0ABD0XM88_UMBPY